MVKDSVFKTCVKNWVNENPNKACVGEERRMLKREYVAACERAGKRISIEEADQAVGSAVRRARGVLIDPGSANTGYILLSL